MKRSKFNKDKDKDSEVNPKFIKKNNISTDNDIDIYYVSIGHNPRRWFDIKDLYYIISKGNKKNPITNEPLSELDIEKIRFHAQKYIKSDNVSKVYDVVPLEERLDELETRLDKEVLNTEQFYSEFLLLREKIESIEKLIS